MTAFLSFMVASGLALSAPAQAQAAFDHSHGTLNRLLDAHVDNGHVQYGNLLASRAQLDAYVESLSAVSRGQETAFSTAQALSFWINAYNALTLWLIIDRAPKKSIRDLGDPWKTVHFEVAGRKVSLDQIEHQIIRKRWKDPRVHAVLVCGAKSCPILESRAFVATTLDRRLELATRRWARDPSKNRYQGDKLEISRIFEWFGQDFVSRYGGVDGTVPGAVRGFFAHFLGEEISATTPMEYMHYNWDLNGTW